MIPLSDLHAQLSHRLSHQRYHAYLDDCDIVAEAIDAYHARRSLREAGKDDHERKRDLSVEPGRSLGGQRDSCHSRDVCALCVAPHVRRIGVQSYRAKIPGRSFLATYPEWLDARASLERRGRHRRKYLDLSSPAHGGAGSENRAPGDGIRRRQATMCAAGAANRATVLHGHLRSMESRWILRATCGSAATVTTTRC